MPQKPLLDMSAMASQDSCMKWGEVHEESASWCLCRIVSHLDHPLFLSMQPSNGCQGTSSRP